MLGNTPMMIQYEKVKAQYEDCILFYRLGDFYEMFGPDAETASRILGIALTGRAGGNGTKVPMCGVPFHAADNYIAKLISAGLKVAVCEQLEDPKAVKGIVKRDVIRIMTPGTVLESNILKEKDSNYLIALVKSADKYALAALEASTGEFMAVDLDNEADVINEILRFEPAECICAINDVNLTNFLKNINSPKTLVVNNHLDYAFKFDFAANRLKEHFKINSLTSLGLEDKPLVTIAAGAILDYVMLMQKSQAENVTALHIYTLDDTMHLDYATKRNLELLKSLHGSEKEDSLFGILDYTKTALGGRLLKNWLERPLIKHEDIVRRLDAVEELYNDNGLRNCLKEHLQPIYDLERITSRIAYGTANAKDLLALKNSLLLFPDVASDLALLKTEAFTELAAQFDVLDDVCAELSQSINEEAPFSLREGNLINPGFNAEVDELRDILHNGKSWILDLEAREKEQTGIKNLKISYNKVFGYYIDIPRAKAEEVPENYLRKQTLANSERFITPELKELESKVLGADEKLKELEYRLFTEVREDIKKQMRRILHSAQIIAEIDCYYSLAQSAVVNNFVKPVISADESYTLKECRHPIVEKKLKNGFFIPNDVYFDRDSTRFLIITGPNMAGKSTFCRSVAMASIMMQIGSFVAAEEAIMPVVDRVFARIGASDDLSSGQSTFMVEMNEVANIVNNATKDSLIILDEVGRGTSTYDGLSLAWALTDYINQRIRAKTMFATHYHELTALEKQEGIKNFSVAVKEDGENIVFLRKIVPGGADRSYGIHVAKLAGIPREILTDAENILLDLEKEEQKEAKEIKYVPPQATQASLFPSKTEPSKVLKKLLKADLFNMTPLDALNLLYDLQTEAKKEDF